MAESALCSPQADQTEGCAWHLAYGYLHRCETCGRGHPPGPGVHVLFCQPGCCPGCTAARGQYLIHPSQGQPGLTLFDWARSVADEAAAEAVRVHERSYPHPDEDWD